MANIVITAGNYVVATKNINDIRERSVGLVGDVSGEKITVFFIGAGRTVETDSNHVAYLDIEKNR